MAVRVLLRFSTGSTGINSFPRSNSFRKGSD